MGVSPVTLTGIESENFFQYLRKYGPSGPLVNLEECDVKYQTTNTILRQNVVLNTAYGLILVRDSATGIFTVRISEMKILDPIFQATVYGYVNLTFTATADASGLLTVDQNSITAGYKTPVVSRSITSNPTCYLDSSIISGPQSFVNVRIADVSIGDIREQWNFTLKSQVLKSKGSLQSL